MPLDIPDILKNLKEPDVESPESFIQVLTEGVDINNLEIAKVLNDNDHAWDMIVRLGLFDSLGLFNNYFTKVNQAIYAKVGAGSQPEIMMASEQLIGEYGLNLLSSSQYSTPMQYQQIRQTLPIARSASQLVAFLQYFGQTFDMSNNFHRSLLSETWGTWRRRMPEFTADQKLFMVQFLRLFIYIVSLKNPDNSPKFRIADIVG